jgi:hypothetical protein
MNNPDDLHRSFRRWQAAEAEGREDDADAEFGAVFGASMPAAGVGAAFTARTMDAVAAAAAREARRARRLRRGAVAAGLVSAVAGVYLGSAFVVSLTSAAVAGAFDLLIGAVVGMAGAAQTGADLWSVLTRMGRAAAAVASDPTVTVMLFALQGIAVAALLALQRLLGTDEESLR